MSMKYILFCLLICCCIQLNAQNVIPLSIEDKKMDSYLMGRKLPTLTIQLKNLPDSVKRVGIQYSLVQLGGEFQTKQYEIVGNLLKDRCNVNMRR